MVDHNQLVRLLPQMMGKNEDLLKVYNQHSRTIQLLTDVCRGSDSKLRLLKDKTNQSTKLLEDQVDRLAAVLDQTVSRLAMHALPVMAEPPSTDDVVSDDHAMAKELCDLKFYNDYMGWVWEKHEEWAIPMYENMDEDLTGLETFLDSVKTRCLLDMSQINLLTAENQALTDKFSYVDQQCRSEVFRLKKEHGLIPVDRSAYPVVQAMERLGTAFKNSLYCVVNTAMMQAQSECFTLAVFESHILPCICLEITPFDPALLEKAKKGDVEATEACFEPNLTVEQVMKSLEGTSLVLDAKRNVFCRILLRRILYLNDEACLSIRAALRADEVKLSDV